MQFLNIGFGNMVSKARIVAMVHPESAPIKRIVKEAAERGALIDASYGRRTQTVIVTDSDHVILSALALDKIAGRSDVADAEAPDED